MYARFKKDPYLLQRYNAYSFVLLPILCAFAAFLKGDAASWLPWLPLAFLFAHSSFKSVVLAWAGSLILLVLRGEPLPALAPALLVVAGVYVGIWSNVLLHNASHNMIKPAWLNRLVGELSGWQVLSGFPGFAVIHIEHHRHADHDEFDPHPNVEGEGFWAYIDNTRARLRRAFARIYRECWGHNETYMASWKKVKWLLPLNRALRAILWLVLLGPVGFTLFFITSHVSTQLSFAVVNYYSHRRRDDGTVEVRNLDHNWAFWILNRGFSGAFYHGNHHLNPKLFNPMKLGRKAEVKRA
jgi:fatty acid desaturase